MAGNATGGVPIAVGYEWRQRLRVTVPDGSSVPFPVGATFRADVRATRASEAVLAALTTAGGGITRASDNEIDLLIPAANTAAFATPCVFMDIVRTDGAAEAFQYLTLRIDVITPITRA
jgi:hypothetical protein